MASIFSYTIAVHVACKTLPLSNTVLVSTSSVELAHPAIVTSLPLLLFRIKLFPTFALASCNIWFGHNNLDANMQGSVIIISDGIQVSSTYDAKRSL